MTDNEKELLETLILANRYIYMEGEPGEVIALYTPPEVVLRNQADAIVRKRKDIHIIKKIIEKYKVKRYQNEK